MACNNYRGLPLLYIGSVFISLLSSVELLACVYWEFNSVHANLYLVCGTLKRFLYCVFCFIFVYSFICPDT